MRILVLNYEYPPLGGGGGRVTQNLVGEWGKLSYKIDIITSRYKDLSKFENNGDINIHRVFVLNRKDQNSATLLSMFFFNISALIKGYKLCRENKYSIINTHFVIPTGPASFLLSKVFKIKNILDVHGGDIYNPNYRIKPHQNFILKNIVKFLLNEADKIVAHSKDVKEKAIKYYKIKKDIKIIPIGYKPYEFQKVSRNDLGLDENDFYMISVGRLILRKRIDRIIKALNKMKDKNIKLLIVGEGPEESSLKNLVKKYDLENRVQFLGFVSEEKKYQYLNCANVFISTSEHEGFGINFQEALYCGLPIISTRSGGPESFLVEKENTLYISESNDIKEIADLVLKLKEKKELCDKMSENNLELIRKFDLSKIAKEYLQTLITR